MAGFSILLTSRELLESWSVLSCGRDAFCVELKGRRVADGISRIAWRGTCRKLAEVGKVNGKGQSVHLVHTAGRCK